jgi:hypothetical protein
MNKTRVEQNISILSERNLTGFKFACEALEENLFKYFCYEKFN